MASFVVCWHDTPPNLTASVRKVIRERGKRIWFLIKFQIGLGKSSYDMENTHKLSQFDHNTWNSFFHRLVRGHVSHRIAFILKDIPTSERDTPCLIGRFVHLVCYCENKQLGTTMNNRVCQVCCKSPNSTIWVVEVFISVILSVAANSQTYKGEIEWFTAFKQ